MPPIDNKKLWEGVLGEMELSVSKPNFNTWFKDTSVYKIEEGVAFVGVPNNFVKDWLHKKYHSSILRILRTSTPSIRSLEYIISRDSDKRRAQNTEKAVTTAFINNELPLNDFYINKEDNLNPRYGFDSFIVGPFNELAYAAAQAVVKKPGIVYNPLFVYGNTGHGKTHLIQAIGNYLKHMYP
jgi:chromosomal replication initiator protein